MTELLRPVHRSAVERSEQHADSRLSVALVCPYSLESPGGVQNHVLGLAGYLSSIGDRVRVLAPGDLDPLRARQHGLSAEQFTSAGSAVPLRYNGSVARVGIGPQAFRRVRHWLSAGDVDLVHIHEPLAPGASLHSLLASRTPVVATFHTATPGSRLMRLAGLAMRPAIDRIGAGIAVSEPARQVVLDHLGRNPRVIPNGISVAEFEHTGAGIAEEHDHPRLVYLGRLDENRKGLNVLLAALPRIHAAWPDLEVIIAGQGNLRKIGRKLPPYCRAVGEIDDRARADLLRRADLFIAPHLGRESFGIVLIEAIASGASVVASDLPAFVDLLQDGGRSHGYLFPAGDPAGLASAVDEALHADRQLMNARARRSVRRFDWSQVGQRIRRVYTDLVRVS